MKSNFAVIGHPLGHTMSPFIHLSLFALSGIEASYKVFDIEPELLSTFIPKLRELDGFNITIPHKQSIIQYIDTLHESASEYSSVNTVLRDGDHLTGFNTDAYGFLKSLEAAGIEIGKTILIMGCGGVARTMAMECVKHGATVTLGIQPSSAEHADKLSKELNGIRPDSCNSAILTDINEHFDLAVNATPVGMYPKIDAMPLNENQLSKISSLFDAVYNPHDTLLLKTADRLGIKSVGGMPMLVYQAVKCHEYWYGADFNTSDIEKLIVDADIEMRRIYE